MPELWDQLAQQQIAEPPSLWPNGDRAPLRITVGGPTLKNGGQAPGYSLDPFNPPPVEYVGRPIAEKLASIFNGPSWLQRATEQSERDRAAYQEGGVPALMADTTVGQELAGGFGGTTVGKLAPALMEAPFYSAAGRAVENAKLGKGTGEQWLGYLRNQPGVKPEELQYVFGNLPEGQLTKAQMQAHAAENAVTLGEVTKGIAPDAEAAGRALAESHGNVWGELSRADRERYIRTADGRRLTDSGGDPKYSQWQLPGGENYRETLLTLPDTTGGRAARMTELERRLQNAGDYDTHEVDAYRREYKRLADATRDKAFMSSHWDEPNVLAHVRTNDREIPGVGKSLHVEEIQSDWHQKGRSGGYSKEEPQWVAYYDSKKGPVDVGRGGSKQDALVDAGGWMELVHIKYRQEPSRMTPGVPDAPFKSTWADVALKRQIREAAEKGYDAISWTPGEAQAARYDLSKHVDKVNLIPHETIHQGGKVNFRVEAYKDNQKVIEHFAKDEKGVADAVGKEVAEKLFSNRNQHGASTVAGLDLKVGGEGMRGFYDKMLVDKANAIGKKHGARVEQSSIEKELTVPEARRQGVPITTEKALMGKQPVHVLRITPELRAAAMKGFPLFSLGAGGAALAPGLFNNPASAPINMWDSNAPN